MRVEPFVTGPVLGHTDTICPSAQDGCLPPVNGSLRYFLSLLIDLDDLLRVDDWPAPLFFFVFFSKRSLGLHHRR